MSSLSNQVAARVAERLGDEGIVNLGIGIPTLVADYVRDRPGLILQTENGMLGVGPTPAAEEVDPDLVNAGKLPVSELPGASYFSSSESFAMIRGGHIDVAVLGILQVDGAGRIANWSLPGRPVLGVGGAMDLLSGARRVIVATAHLNKAGEPKVVERCSYPLTGARPVDLIVTEKATIRVGVQCLELIEVARGCSVEWVLAHTGAELRVAPGLADAANTAQGRE